MGSEITRHEPNRYALAAYRDGSEWDKIQPQEVALSDVEAALDEVRGWLVPLKDRDRRFDMIDPVEILRAIEENPETRQMVEAVKMIGRKIRPDFTASQASHWVAAIVASLTDMPPHISVQASKAALHVPIEFLSKVEGVIRDKAAEIEVRYSLAQRRLERLRREIERAANPAPALPPREPLTVEELQDMPPHMRSLGLAAGWLRETEDGRIEWNPEPSG